MTNENDVEIEGPPNWPGTIIMISFFITVIVICGLCTWGAIKLMGDS